MADYRPEEGRGEFPPDVVTYKAKVEFAREHGTFGRLRSGRGRILPIIQELAGRLLRNNDHEEDTDG